ncbi:MAG TPA: PrpR N-terminal domain-containing protein, partial [Clostridia bacterium]|nr:PrpR N-terminal domain-containing protein [Clostridia bacterium]
MDTKNTELMVRKKGVITVSQIGYIAPNMKMAMIAKNVFSEHGIEVAVEIGNIENGADKAEALAKKGVKAFIARGGTTLSIRNRLDVPVIEISIMIEDIVNALLKASRFGNKIGIIGFYNLLNGLESFNPLLKIELKQVYVKNESQLYEEIYKAKKEGIDVII